MFNGALKKQLELSESKVKKYEQIFSSLKSEMLHLVLSPGGKVEEANNLFESETGLSASEYKGRRLPELVPAKARDTSHYHHMVDAIKNHKHWEGAFELDVKGQTLWLRIIIQPVQNTEGQCESLDIFGTNLTRTITTSRHNENLLEALLRSMAMIEFTPDGHIESANPLFLKTVGYRLDEVKGKHHAIFCSKDVRESRDYKSFWERLGRGEFIVSRFHRIAKNGDDIWLEASYNPIKDHYGRVYKVVKFATDVTDQVYQEQQVTDATKMAAEISENTGQRADEGARQLRETARVISMLSGQLQDASTKINALEEQSSAISAMVSSISGIADQTNLLALNAAIEAARAGEQGRGFAVVADEVRELASRTSRSTDEIISVFSNNEALTKESVKTIAQGLETMKKINELVKATDGVINDIQGGADKVVEAISQLSQRL